LIQEFYLTLRQKHKSSDSTPITTRQLESMIRLSEGRARMVLSPIITKEHAQDVIEIMKESLYERFEDEFGQLDFRRATGSSRSKDMSRFVTALQKAAQQRGQSVFTTQEMFEVSQQLRLIVPNFDDFVEALNVQNYLLKKGPRLYKLMV
jgi:DNA helicase MCM8